MKKYIIAVIVIIIAVAIVIKITNNDTVSSANPLNLIVSNTNATTTVNSVTPATSYNSDYDSYTSGRTNVGDKIVLFTQMTASSSASSVSIKIQHSMDGIDWFTENSPLVYSTTTSPFLLTNNGSFIMLGNTTASTTRYAVVVTPAARFIRATYSSAVGTSTIWSNFIIQKQLN